MNVNKSDSLKNIFQLRYDSSNKNSGLIKWYNNLINKTIDELTVIDVSKMIRQDILKDTAVIKAIELFIKDSFAGEMRDGDLLATLASVDSNIFFKNIDVKGLVTYIEELEESYLDFDWENENDRNSFKQKLVELKQKLTE